MTNDVACWATNEEPPCGGPTAHYSEILYRSNNRAGEAVKRSVRSGGLETGQRSVAAWQGTRRVAAVYHKEKRAGARWGQGVAVGLVGGEGFLVQATDDDFVEVAGLFHVGAVEGLVEGDKAATG